MKNLMKQMVVGGAVVMTLGASETLAYAKEKGVSGSWTLYQMARSSAISRARHQAN